MSELVGDLHERPSFVDQERREAVARIEDDELRDAAAEDGQRRAQARARHAEATRSYTRSSGSSATCSRATTAS